MHLACPGDIYASRYTRFCLDSNSAGSPGGYLRFDSGLDIEQITALFTRLLLEQPDESKLSEWTADMNKLRWALINRDIHGTLLRLLFIDSIFGLKQRNPVPRSMHNTNNCDPFGNKKVKNKIVSCRLLGRENSYVGSQVVSKGSYFWVLG